MFLKLFTYSTEYDSVGSFHLYCVFHSEEHTNVRFLHACPGSLSTSKIVQKQKCKNTEPLTKLPKYLWKCFITKGASLLMTSSSQSYQSCVINYMGKYGLNDQRKEFPPRSFIKMEPLLL